MEPFLDDLYRALQERDVETLLARLHPEFEGRIAPGMPFGVGGVHHGPEAMLAEVWGVVAGAFDTAPYPEAWQTTAEGTVVVTGRYRGTAARTGRVHEAEFVHLWTLRDGQALSLHQYTDTARWHEALQPA
jgi:uncharacterized protein